MHLVVLRFSSETHARLGRHVLCHTVAQRAGQNRSAPLATKHGKALNVPDGARIRGVVSGYVGCAMRLYVWESSDGWLAALATYECVQSCSSMLWLIPFTPLLLPLKVPSIAVRQSHYSILLVEHDVRVRRCVVTSTLFGLSTSFVTRYD